MTVDVTANGYLPPKKVSPWRNIGAAVVYFLVYIVIQTVIVNGYYLYLVLSTPSGLDAAEKVAWRNAQYYQNGNLLMIIIDAVLLASMAIWFAARKKKVLPSLGMTKPRMVALPAALVAGIGMSCILSFIMIFVNELMPEVMESYGSTMDVTYNMQDVLMYALAGVVGAPLIEELFFRHLMAGRLSRSIPRGVAIVLTSVIFGLIHEHPVQWVYAGVLGFIMACLYFAYDSIWVSVVFHAGFNSVSLLSYIDLSGMSEEQLAEFDLLIYDLYRVFSILGIAALILLFILRTSRVFYKSPAVEPMVPLDTPETVPGVAPLGEGYFADISARNELPGVADLTAAPDGTSPTDGTLSQECINEQTDP
ncbi:MAG: CPBP family intramembrane metalloprotease [Clostridia bacterium]|nr:CPBP family intramembrane metalloprotease [Clostridia bacterium]